MASIKRSASAQWQGTGKDGKGALTTQSGTLKGTPYGFNSRFGDGQGTNPEELIAAAHAGCFTMALSFALAGAGYTDGTLDTDARVTVDKDGDGFTITSSKLHLKAKVPGIAADEFARIAEEAKANCPVSKLLKADISLTHELEQ